MIKQKQERRSVSHARPGMRMDDLTTCWMPLSLWPSLVPPNVGHFDGVLSWWLTVETRQQPGTRGQAHSLSSSCQTCALFELIMGAEQRMKIMSTDELDEKLQNYAMQCKVMSWRHTLWETRICLFNPVKISWIDKVVLWCSGYHICFTRRRSPVRSWAGSYHFRKKTLKYNRIYSFFILSKELLVLRKRKPVQNKRVA